MSDYDLNSFLHEKSEQSLLLFNHFVAEYNKIGNVSLYPTKSMAGIAVNDGRRIAWITQLGKNFIHVVFPFKKPFYDNLCFQKIAQVPGSEQYNHHFRMYLTDDLNDEVESFMQMAFEN